MSEILKICGIAVITVSICAALKALNPSLSAYIPQISAILIFIGAISALSPVITFIKEVSGNITDKNISLTTLMIAGGIAVISKIVSDLCKENGHEMLRGAVDFAANIEILLLCIPVLRKLFVLSAEVMSL